MSRLISKSADETRKFAEKIAKSLKPGRVIALYGDLGSGKTTFVQGLAAGFEIKHRIISPTFIIIRSYQLKTKNLKPKMFYHIDLYRTGKADFDGLGLKEIINDKNGFVAIEWAEKIEKFLPKNSLKIKLEILSDNEREIKVENG